MGSITENQSISLSGDASYKILDSRYSDVENAELLKEAIRVGLPPHYDFEIFKTIKRINELKSTSDDKGHFTVYLQMPEGLLVFSQSISLILQHFTQANVVIIGDITYGGCCIEDQLMNMIESSNSKSSNLSLLVHYAHSCLIPFEELASPNETNIANVLYVFVEINLLSEHFIQTIKHNFRQEDKIALLSTIQYHSTIVSSLKHLNEYFSNPVKIPVCDPLAWGETLGCTSAVIDDDVEKCIFLSDGRFHLESAMMQNPDKIFYLYEPFSKKITREIYNHRLLHEMRKSSIINSFKINEMGGNNLINGIIIVGIFFSTLGRQGSFAILERLEKLIKKYNMGTNCKAKLFACSIFASDLSAESINNNFLEGMDYSIQLACPRLSTDWGIYYTKPILNSYEAFVLLGNLSNNNFQFFNEMEDNLDTSYSEFSYLQIYPMNYWAANGNIWCNYYLDESRNGSFAASKERIDEIKYNIRQNKFKNLTKRKINLHYENK
ncbi:diphthamide synthesis protein [Cryptosporidium ubiquitum]|uniref:2-(3-amino-3-carboxypropyl)histidine synthase subunit 1 n=1 Tax=Cryptosporidium ubiquitum TaxID=857276 RepID=A0A1J4MJB7_9CRYT|nr:diphthamide synthesis protein [Cryptosporidium ubiquitum]OII73116.1 diphthamide synthesis protein [Cryptosporidium ubiquitum]